MQAQIKAIKWSMTLLCILIVSVVFGQIGDFTPQDRAIFEDATANFNKNNYYKALQLFRSLYKTHPDDLTIILQTNACYFKLPDLLDKAQPLLIKAQSLASSNLEVIFQLGYFDYLNENFKGASNYFEKYLSVAPMGNEAAWVKTLLIETKLGLKWQDWGNKGRETNLGSPPNSEFEEKQGMLSKQSKQIFFTYKGVGCKGNLLDLNLNPSENGDFNEDIYYCDWLEGAWSKPNNIGTPINTDEQEFIDWVSPKGDAIVFERHGVNSGHVLLFTRKINEKWENPIPIGPAVQSSYWIGQAWLNTNMDTMFFSANLPEGKGGKDIFMSSKSKDGNWSSPINIGPSINGPGDETTPFLNIGGDTLYFGSNGGEGLGLSDIYFSTKNKSGWSNPQTLGSPINSVQNNEWIRPGFSGYEYLVDGYRKNGKGQSDLYFCRIQEPELSTNTKNIDYWLQVGAFRHPENFKLPMALKSPLHLIRKTEGDGITRIAIAGISDLQAAENLKQALTSKGMKGLWINIKFNGKKISLAELKAMEKKQIK